MTPGDSPVADAASGPSSAPVSPLVTRRLARMTSVADLQACSRRMLPRMIYDYVAGGADNERSLAWNYDDLDRWAILPRMLAGTRTRATATFVLGIDHRLPVFIAPTGLSGALWRSGETEAARAAVRQGVSMMVSAASTQSLETIARGSGNPSRLAFQQFIYKDRGFTVDLAMRAKQAGYGALVITVDVPVSGRRGRDVRNGFTIPPEVRWRTALDLSRRAPWAVRARPVWRINFANFTTAAPPSSGAVKLGQMMSSLADPSVVWDDVAVLREVWDGPLVIKGILNTDDALRARDHGADAVVVSNHGGRQLDGAVSAVEMLPEVRAAVGPDYPVLFDSGIRTGRDIVVAMALGADAVGIGRSHLWGLAVGGGQGVDKVFEILGRELDDTMTLAGIDAIADLCRDALLRRRS